MKQEIKKDWLVGRWEPADGSYSVILEISTAGRGFNVRAYAELSNQELIVSKTKWDGKILRFESLVPSSNIRTRNCLTPIAKTRLLHELTIWETLKRMKGTKAGGAAIRNPAPVGGGKGK